MVMTRLLRLAEMHSDALQVSVNIPEIPDTVMTALPFLAAPKKSARLLYLAASGSLMQPLSFINTKLLTNLGQHLNKQSSFQSNCNDVSL